MALSQTFAPKRVLLAGTFLSGHVGTRAPIEDLAERLEAAGYQCLRVSSIRQKFVRAAHLLSTALIARDRYDVAVVDLYSGNAFLWGHALGVLLSRLGIPFVYSMHGGALPEFAAAHAGRMKRCLRRASAVTAPSRYLLENMRTYVPEAELLPNPLDTSKYSFRLRNGVRPALIWVRRFHRMYNPALAPRVLAQVAAEYPDATLTMIGRDEQDGSLAETRQVAKELRVSNRIEFRGAAVNSEIPRHLEKADIFLNTTDVDNTPVSVMEAMASGLCVVSTNAGGVPMLVSDGEDGLLAPCGDADGLASGVKRLLSDSDLARRISEAGRRKTEQFDWQFVLPRWEELLDRIGARA